MGIERIAVTRLDNGEILGYVVGSGESWQAETVFGYVFARSTDQKSIERAVREQIMSVLQGVWQYLDPDDGNWHACILKDIAPQQVTVIRTNDMGYQNPKTAKFVVIKHPDETKLVRA